MDALADALVYAVAYISRTEDRREDHLDDVRALESIANLLSAAREQEKDSLGGAAERAVDVAQNQLQNSELVEIYGTWMEHMFGDEWKGNRRM